MSSNPRKSDGVLVISCNTLPPENVIKQILGKEDLPEATDFSGVKGYLWSFETKYYSANVYLYALEQKKELDSEFSGTVKAIIFYFDGFEPSGFEEIKSWMPHLKNIDAEVQLLICDEIRQSEERKCILKWCVENQYELVELNSPTESDEEDEPIIKDVKGYARVVQSLQSHTWANLIMKGEKMKNKSKEKVEIDSSKNCEDSEEKNNPSGVTPEESTSENGACKSESKMLKTSFNGIEIELPAEYVPDFITSRDPEYLELEKQIDKEYEEYEKGNLEPGAFADLFARFACVKGEASKLQGEERLKYAEKIAVEFWKSIGGSDSEIEGIEDEWDD